MILLLPGLDFFIVSCLAAITAWRIFKIRADFNEAVLSRHELVIF